MLRNSTTVITLIEVNACDLNGQTALILGAKNGHDFLVKLLLKNPAIDVDIKDSNEETALIWAKKNGLEKIVGYIKQHLTSIE